MRKKCQLSPNGFLALLSLAPSTVWPMNYPKLWFAYTLGRTDIYEPLRKKRLTPLRKLGLRPIGSPNEPQGYKGGAVWKTYHDAAAYMHSRRLRGYSVYFLRLRGLWEEVTYQDGGLHLLKYDAYILYPVEKSVMTLGILA